MQSNLNKHTVWLDCDPGLDDTLAIILACRDPRIHLLGVSTSPGNTNLQNTTRNALDVLYNSHRSDVPVIVGSNKLVKGQMKFAQHMHGSNGLGGIQIPKSKSKPITEDSFKTIATMILNSPSPVIWANTGSLTNLHFLISDYPQVLKNIKEIVAMGGSIGQGNVTPAAQFNIYFDPFAAESILKIKGQTPFVLAPLDLTHQVVTTQKVFQELEKQTKPFAKSIYSMLRQYQNMYHFAYGDRFPLPPVHDPCVIYYILEPQEFVVKKAIIEVDTCPVSYGRTNIYFSYPKKPNQPIQSVDKVALSIKSLDKFWELNLKHFREIWDKDIEQ